MLLKTISPQQAKQCATRGAVLVDIRPMDEHLRERAYLLDDFTVADILMITVLRFIKHTDMLGGFPALAAYVARCTERPAFKRALDAQLADFDAPIAA